MTDLEALQGVWEQVGLEADGVVDPVDAHSGAGALTTFAETEFSVRTVDGMLLLVGAFELDEDTKSVTWIDSLGDDAGKRLPAIYRLDGDHFVFIAGNEGASPPTVFATAAGQTMRTFVRQR